MKLIKLLLPPILWDIIYHSPLRRYGWFGNYDSWEQAENNSKGYDSKIIIDKVKEATLKVKASPKIYERDSVIFNKIEYDWPVLAGLLWVAAQNGGQLNVIDFGGSLGSTYWQNRKFLTSVPSVKWNIIEQKYFVECGKKYIESETIKFYYDFPSCLLENKPNVVLLSSVLSYIRDPYELLLTIINLNIQYLIIDRLLTIDAHNDRLTVQIVPPSIYRASYPAWFFSEDKFMKFIKGYFDVVDDYNCRIELNLRSHVKGLILRKL